MMAIVDPFETAVATPKGIVDPFETKTDAAKPEAGGVLSDFGKETAAAAKSGWQHLTPKPSQEPGDSFMSGFFTGPFERGIGGVTRALAPLELATSPLTGAIHSFGGRGLAGLESLVGEAAVGGLKRLGLTKGSDRTPRSGEGL